MGIFGIIIDTFSELRTERVKRLSDTEETCFICGIEKQEFDRQSVSKVSGFSDHYHNDHNLWAYFYFMVFIAEQDKDDDDGLEQYVRKKIEFSDITWFPASQAMRMDQEEEENLGAKIDTVQKEVTTVNKEVTAIADSVTKLIERIDRDKDHAGREQESKMAAIVKMVMEKEWGRLVDGNQ